MSFWQSEVAMGKSLNCVVDFPATFDKTRGLERSQSSANWSIGNIFCTCLGYHLGINYLVHLKILEIGEQIHENWIAVYFMNCLC